MQRLEDPVTASVRVMTIHKAKGLQFDIVILPELDVNMVGHAPAVLTHCENVTGLPTRVIPYISKELQPLVPEFAEIAQKWRFGQVRESINLLYVALTRAVHALVMVIAPSDKNDCPLSFAGILRHSLADGGVAAPSKVLFECGNANWHSGRVVSGEVARVDSEPITSVLLKAPTTRKRGLQRTSPSSAADGATVRISEIFKRDTQSLRLGSIFHALFEQIRWIEDGIPTEDALCEIAREAGASAMDAVEIVREFVSTLDRPEVRAMLSRSSYSDPECSLEVHCELPFALRDETRLVTGAMDRVVVRRCGNAVRNVDVLDYKTDARSEYTRPERVELYKRQLEMYRWAATRLFSVDASQVRARLLFVRDGCVVDVTMDVA